MMINSEQTVVTIDQGNTLVKMALFQGDRLLKIVKTEKVDTETIARIFDDFQDMAGERPIVGAILSSVASSANIIWDTLKVKVKIVEFTLDIPLPVNIMYKTPSTLGKDRVAAACAGVGLFPGKSVLTIDAGTCITYDLVTSTHDYLGGSISPGMLMRLRALNTFTEKLPFVEPEENVPLIGRSTHDSILSGVINGIIQEMNGIINEYMLKYPNLKVVLTGGDSKYFDKKIKNIIFANPNLVLLGLRDIILLHVEI